MEHPSVYLISDLHLGAGRDTATGNWDILEDFTADTEFCAFLDHISGEPGRTELVIAGDFIEYLQILPQFGLQSPLDHLGTTEEQSLQRTYVVLGQLQVSSGHPLIFARLRQFLKDGHNITILAGNHDVDLLWEKVWLLLRYNLSPPGSKGKLSLKPFCYTVGTAERGQVYIEHGNERDRKNSFGNQMENPFGFDQSGVKRLKRNWGTLFVDKVFNQLEKQYSFIDNVKPISRVVKLGLRGDLVYTATAMALITRFYLMNNPFLGVSYGLPGVGETETVDEVIASIDDDDLRSYIQQRVAHDPAFRAAFEHELYAAGGGEQQALQEMQSEVESQPFDEVEDNTNGAPSFGIGGVDEDPYRQAAREVLEQDERLCAVVMGHTHAAIDGQEDPVHLSDGRTGLYFNSGTWTPCLHERPAGDYTWDELKQAGNYTASLDYVRMIPNQKGEYRVELRSWSEDGK